MLPKSRTSTSTAKAIGFTPTILTTTANEMRHSLPTGLKEDSKSSRLRSPSSNESKTAFQEANVKGLAKHLVWCWLLSQLVVPLRAAESARLVKYAQTDVVPIHAKVRFSTLIVLPAD